MAFGNIIPIGFELENKKLRNIDNNCKQIISPLNPALTEKEMKRERNNQFQKCKKKGLTTKIERK